MNALCPKITKSLPLSALLRHIHKATKDLVIMTTPQGRTVRRRPLPAIALRLVDYEAWTENLPKPYPFGLESTGSTYHDAVHHLFIDHAKCSHVFGLYVIDLADSDQPAPMVNMVAIH
jgi:hypothetical protein